MERGENPGPGENELETQIQKQIERQNRDYRRGREIIPSRGAVPEPLLLEVSRHLTAGDLARMHDTPKVAVPILRRITATHHKQALLLAEGKTPSQIAAIVGCTVTRINQLQTDPAFGELVNYYRDQIMTTLLSDAIRLKGKILDVGEMAVDEMRERMEDDGIRKKLPIGEVRKIAEFAMDRTVAPPQAINSAPPPPQTVTINFGTNLKPKAENSAETTGENQTSALSVNTKPIIDENGNEN